MSGATQNVRFMRLNEINYKMANVSGYSVSVVQNYYWFVWLSDDTLWLKVR
jgi:hypothetical protein